MSRKNKILTEAEISSFCQQINMIVKAGLPTYYGVSILRDEAVNETSRKLYAQIYEPMEKGATLYEALLPMEVFPEYMLEMIHVGERTGRLEEVLDSLVVYYDREAQIRDGIKQAVTYPLIMSGMMLAVIFVMITKVVPIFSDVYAQLGSTLSGPAKWLMDVSTFLNKNILFLLLTLLILIFALYVLSKTPAGKTFLESKGIAPTLAASRFANCMYLALASGLDSDQGLTMAKSLVQNGYYAKKIQECKNFIQKGTSFSESLLLSGLFSKVYSSMITIGYKTSAMDDVMLRISKAYETETDESIRRFIAILEPTLIIVLSFFIGLILISFLLPLLGIMASIG